jgi:hypothetical protein
MNLLGISCLFITLCFSSAGLSGRSTSQLTGGQQVKTAGVPYDTGHPTVRRRFVRESVPEHYYLY